MADMTTKHHRLISDGIIAGVEKFMGSRCFINLMDAVRKQNNMTLPSTQDETDSFKRSQVLPFVRTMLTCLAQEMCERLAYTNDNFDKSKWSSQISFCDTEVTRKFDTNQMS